MVNIGFWATAGAGGGGGGAAYELISSTILASTTASVTFSSIPSSFKHLQVRIAGRLAGGGVNPRPFQMRLNGSSAALYATHRLYGNGGVVASSSATDTNEIGFSESIPTSSHVSGVYNAALIDILNYASTTNNKTVRASIGFTEPTDRNVGLHSGLWRSTAAVSSIEFADQNGFQFAAGSRFSLYGIRG